MGGALSMQYTRFLKSNFFKTYIRPDIYNDIDQELENVELTDIDRKTKLEQSVL